jgi:hypothetical protein
MWQLMPSLDNLIRTLCWQSRRPPLLGWTHCQQLLSKLSINPLNDKGYSLKDGILRYKGRIWEGANPTAQAHILQALHSSGIGEHSGQLATYKRIK